MFVISWTIWSYRNNIILKNYTCNPVYIPRISSKQIIIIFYTTINLTLYTKAMMRVKLQIMTTTLESITDGLLHHQDCTKGIQMLQDWTMLDWQQLVLYADIAQVVTKNSWKYWNYLILIVKTLTIREAIRFSI